MINIDQKSLNRKRRILIVEDDRSMRKGLSLELSDRGYEIIEASTFDDGLKAVTSETYDLMITDLRLPDKDDGIKLVRELKNRSPQIPAVVITAFGSIEAAVKAMRVGAEDFITKGFTIDELTIKMEKLFEKASLLVEKERLTTENVTLRNQIEQLLPQWELVGTSKPMNLLRKQLNEYAQTDFTILIQGETGTGKELVARSIHQAGLHRLKPFVVVNCSAIPRDLIESELFGYEKGAFTGAQSKKLGQFEAAQDGVIFLDEVGDIDLGLQSKLLRVIEYKEFNRIGGTKPVTIKAQIIAATNRELDYEVATGRFREDLFYRLNVMVIRVPPLRERKEDIPELVCHFLQLFVTETGEKSYTATPGAIDHLQSYSWPGNIRELKNVVFRAAALSKKRTITPQTIILPQPKEKIVEKEFPGHDHRMRNKDDSKHEILNLGPESFKQAQEIIEEQYLRQALIKTSGKIRATARLLGLSRNTVKKMLQKYHLNDINIE